MGVRREARDALAAAQLRPRKRWDSTSCATRRRTPDRRHGGGRAGSAVLEIGPGLGAPHDALAAACAGSIGRIDRGLAERLQERFAPSPT